MEFYLNGNLAATLTAAPYSYTANNLTAGSYALTVKAVDGFGLETTSPARTIVVSNTNNPPTVSLTAPANNSTVTAPVTVSANANAVEVNGSITQVEFYANGNLIGSDTSAPYSISWTPEAGTYSLTARATDNLGAQTTSNARSVTVITTNQPPTVTLTSPANNATYGAPASIALSANPQDSDGTITQVDFYNGATLIGTVTSPPYNATWAAVPAGNYVLTAKATDNLNAVTTSAPVNITVQATAPTGMFFIHPDHLNTPRLITDQAGTVVWRWDNDDPFGNNAPNENPSGVGAFTCNLRLPGQYFDRETNLHYNYFRDGYDSATGRYTQFDPIGLAGGINGYAYVGGNPVSYSDPTGLETYQCRRPLGGLPGDNQRNGPDIWGNPFYHQYSCTRNANGKLVCNSQSNSGSWWNSPGQQSTLNDYYDAKSCTQTQGNNKCFEQCLVEEWKKPRPRYGMPFGTDCQEYDDDVNRTCRKKCGLK